jgi:ADP-ribose pyrophosphatase
MTWPFGRIGNSRVGEIQLSQLGHEDPWVFRNKFLEVRNDSVLFPSGEGGRHLSLHSPAGGAIGGVVMLPVLGDGRIVFLRQFRHGSRRWEIELPRGFIDANETSEQAAHRELQEEYGVRAEELSEIGRINADTALFGYDAACYLCRLESLPSAVGDFFKSPPLVLSVDEAMKLVSAGKICDAYSLACIAVAVSKRLLHHR